MIKRLFTNLVWLGIAFASAGCSSTSSNPSGATVDPGSGGSVDPNITTTGGGTAGSNASTDAAAGANGDADNAPNIPEGGLAPDVAPVDAGPSLDFHF